MVEISEAACTPPVQEPQGPLTLAPAGTLGAPPLTSPQPSFSSQSDAQRFFNALYPSEGLVSFRTLFEGGRNGAPSNHAYELGPSFPDTLALFLKWAADEERSVFVVPGIVRPHTGGCKNGDVIGMPAIVADFDKDDPTASLAAAEALLGPASVVVESGGQTDHGPKLHAYWKLAEVARGEDIAKVCAIQAAIANQCGGDKSFGHPAQIIRLPSSWHRKNEPVQVRLREPDPEAVVELNAVAAKLSITAAPATPGNNVYTLDFGRREFAPKPDAERALTAPVHEGAADEITRFEAAGQALGHFIRMAREGRYDLDGAWQAAKDWNQATLVPPWPEERLRTDFERLVRIDHDTHGPISTPIFQPTQNDWQFADWHVRRFKGVAPERQWLVDGVIPVAVPGLFAAVGDAGKSMLALRLALVVACHPAPETTRDSPAGISDTPRFFGRPITARGTAVVLTAEDDEDEVHRRLEALDPAGLRGRASSRLYVLPLLSVGGARALVVDGPSGPHSTPFWVDLRAKLLALPDLRLVVIDPLSHFIGTDMNDNTAGAALMAELNGLAKETGATVLLIHHLNKAGKITNLSDARNAILGAGAWVNNSRFAMVLWEADADAAYSTLKTLGRSKAGKPPAGLVYFGGLTKSNAPGEKSLRTLARNTGTGLLEDVTDAVRAATPRADDVYAQFHAALMAYKAQDPGFYFTRSASALNNAWGPVLAERDLPISKDGKGHGKYGMVAVLDELLARGWVKRTADRTVRYEPVERPEG